jgi:hypothetical protein
VLHLTSDLLEIRASKEGYQEETHSETQWRSSSDAIKKGRCPVEINDNGKN